MRARKPDAPPTGLRSQLGLSYIDNRFNRFRQGFYFFELWVLFELRIKLSESQIKQITRIKRGGIADYYCLPLRVARCPYGWRDDLTQLDAT